MHLKGKHHIDMSSNEKSDEKYQGSSLQSCHYSIKDKIPPPQNILNSYQLSNMIFAVLSAVKIWWHSKLYTRAPDTFKIE